MPRGRRAGQPAGLASWQLARPAATSWPARSGWLDWLDLARPGQPARQFSWIWSAMYGCIWLAGWPAGPAAGQPLQPEGRRQRLALRERATSCPSAQVFPLSHSPNPGGSGAGHGAYSAGPTPTGQHVTHVVWHGFKSRLNQQILRLYSLYIRSESFWCARRKGHLR